MIFTLILNLLAIVGVLLTLAGTVELALLTFGAMFPVRREAIVNPNLNLAVVIPAHNEAANIANSVHSVLACAKPQGKFAVYVIADNCSDDTAAQARLAGAEVLVRENAELRGKGYALDFAFSQLQDEFDALLVIDADTVVEPYFLIACAEKFVAGADAVQCRYGVNNPEATVRTRLLHVALMAFNTLRPRGREYWGWSVGISGNGFGLSTRLLKQIPYTARSVVEDLEYHLMLVKAGFRVQFVDSSTVRADMPVNQQGADSQRARWEGGRLRMVREFAPKLLAEINQGHTRLFEPLLDLLLLPLAAHVLVLGLLLPLAPIYASIGLSIVLWHVAVALWVGGGTLKDVLTLCSVPFYVLWKLRLLPRLLKASKKDAAWVRTKRDGE